MGRGEFSLRSFMLKSALKPVMTLISVSLILYL